VNNNLSAMNSMYCFMSVEFIPINSTDNAELMNSFSISTASHIMS